MRALAAVAVLGLVSCQEPPKTGQMEAAVRALSDLHLWDPSTEARGQMSYDAIVSWGPEILPSLVAHLTDESPTMLYDRTFDITVTLGDVCFYLLLRLMGLSWQEFMNDGVFVTTSLPNPIFCIRWKEPTLSSRRRVQLRFIKLLPKPEDQ
jgi:hypothetical protein